MKIKPVIIASAIISLIAIAAIVQFSSLKVHAVEGCSNSLHLVIPPGFTNLPSGTITCWNTNGAINHDNAWRNEYLGTSTEVQFCEGDWLTVALPGQRCANGDCSTCLMTCTSPANPEAITHSNLTANIPDGSHSAVFILHKNCMQTTCAVWAELDNADTACNQQ